MSIGGLRSYNYSLYEHVKSHPLIDHKVKFVKRTEGSRSNLTPNDNSVGETDTGISVKSRKLELT